MRQSLGSGNQQGVRDFWRLLLAVGVALATFTGWIVTSVIGWGDAFADGLTRIFARNAPPRAPSPLMQVVGSQSTELVTSLTFWMLAATTVALVVALLIDGRRIWLLFGSWAGAVGLHFGVAALSKQPGHTLQLVLVAATWVVYVCGVGWCIARSDRARRGSPQAMQAAV